MVRDYKRRERGKWTYQAYTTESLEQCLQNVTNGNLSTRKAAEIYKIPRATVKNKLEGKHSKGVGGQTVFTRKEEELFVSRIISMCNWGFPLDKFDLRMVVSAYLTKQKRIVHRFKEKIPGDDWAISFMKRWNLTNRIATHIQRKQAEMSKEEVEKYFANIETELQGVCLQNIWNYDETNVRDNPGSKKAVMKKGTKYPECVMDSNKVCYSLMFCGNAEGPILPPYTVYKSVHLYDSWVKGSPEGARYNRMKSGWFDEATFEDWFFTLVLPKLRKQEGKKILIGDNLSSHLSPEVIKACNNHNISFICLLPNATYHLQPLDVAFYGPLKKVWRSLLFEWRKTSTGCKYGTLPKERFAPLLKQLIEKLMVEGNGRSNLINGFRKCGIYPFNPDEVYKKLPSENVMSPKKALDQSLVGRTAQRR